MDRLKEGESEPMHKRIQDICGGGIEKMCRISLNRPVLGKEENEAIAAVMNTGMVSSGKVVEEFEEVVKKYVGARNAIAVSSGTAGLYLAMGEMGMSVGIPAFTFPAAQAVAHNLRLPVVDIDVSQTTYNMDMRELQKNAEFIGGVVPIHQFGLTTNMNVVNAIARDDDLFVVEDAACALGSKQWNGEMVGKTGTAVFSFHGRKIITTGEGGMIVTDNDELAEDLRNGRTPKTRGLNFKMSDIVAAMGIAQMNRIDELIEARRKIAREYSMKLRDYVDTPAFGAHDERSNWQSYVVTLRKGNRDDVIEQMRTKGIECQVGSYDNSHGGCITSAYLAARTIALPIWSGMFDNEINKVVEGLKECIQ